MLGHRSGSITSGVGPTKTAVKLTQYRHPSFIFLDPFKTVGPTTVSDPDLDSQQPGTVSSHLLFFHFGFPLSLDPTFTSFFILDLCLACCFLCVASLVEPTEKAEEDMPVSNPPEHHHGRAVWSNIWSRGWGEVALRRWQKPAEKRLVGSACYVHFAVHDKSMGSSDHRQHSISRPANCPVLHTRIQHSFIMQTLKPWKLVLVASSMSVNWAPFKLTYQRIVINLQCKERQH